MRIVLVHRYFWPDTPPYAHILLDIALRLGAAGHEVTVLTCQPSYQQGRSQAAPARETIAEGVQVRRWKVLPDRRSTVLKGVNLVVFCAHLLGTAARGQVDVVMVGSTPPIAVARVGSWIAALRGARFCYHKQDIYPEVVVASGILRAGRLPALLRRWDARTERRADRVVVLSADMAATERFRGVEGSRIVVINNFDPWRLSDQGGAADGHRMPRRGEQPSFQGPSDELCVVFTGNLGRFQNLEVVFDAVGELQNEPRVAFHFFGDGALRSRLEERVAREPRSRVVFHGHRAPDEVAAFLRERADIGIVSLAPGVIRAAYPSKTMSYLRQGCPVLVLVERDSELARAVVDSGSGVQVDPRDARAMADCLRGLLLRRRELREMGAQARALYDVEFNPDRQLDRWVEMFDDLMATAPV